MSIILNMLKGPPPQELVSLLLAVYQCHINILPISVITDVIMELSPTDKLPVKNTSLIITSKQKVN